MKRFKDFIKKAIVDRSKHMGWDMNDVEHHPEEKDRSKHLGWSMDDVEHHGTDDDIQEGAGVHLPYGGLKNPKGGTPKYWKAGGMGASHGADGSGKTTAGIPSRPAEREKKPYHSDHPDQTSLVFKGEKKAKPDNNKIHDIKSVSIIQHHDVDQLESEFGSHGKSLVYGEKKTIEHYKGGMEMNQVLRNSKGKNKGEYGQSISAMDHITSHKTSQPLTTYRGVHDKTMIDLPVGHKFTDHGFTGTTIRPSIATKFGTGDEGHIFRIHSPAGTKMHYLDMHPNNYDNEREVNLNRGTKFKIMKRSKTETGQHVIDLHVVGQRKDKKNG
jgi:hypothetical protein